MSVRVVPLLTATSLGHHWPRALGSPRHLSLCISPIPRIFYTSRISLPDRSSSSSSQDHFFWDHFYRVLFLGTGFPNLNTVYAEDTWLVVLSHVSLIEGFGMRHLISPGVIKIYNQPISVSVASSRLEHAEFELQTFTHPHTYTQ